MENHETGAVQSAEPGMSDVSRLASIFLEPGRTLEDVGRRPTWLLPLLVTLVIGFVPYVLQPHRVSREARTKAAAEQAAKWGAGDPQKLYETMMSQPEGNFTRYQAVIFGLPFGFLATLAVAGIVLLAFILAGAQLTYKKSMAAWCWSIVAPGVVAGLLSVLFLFVKAREDLNPLDPRANVLSHLGFLASEKNQPVLHGLLGSIDLFSFWTIYMLGLGYAAVSQGRLTTKKATTVIALLWVLYVMIKTGLTGIFA